MIIMARDARDITVISTTLTSMPASVCLAVVLRTVARGKSDAVSDFNPESATAARMRHDAVQSFLAELHSEPVVERAMPEAIFHGQQRAADLDSIGRDPAVPIPKLSGLATVGCHP